MSSHHSKAVYTFLLIFFLSTCLASTPLHSNTAGDSACTVVLNTDQPVLLIDLMHYIKCTYGSYSVSGIAPGEAAELIKQNQNDSALMRRIDLLLGSPVYKYLSQLMQATVEGKLIKGSDAYRMAFILLPWHKLDMSAGYITRLAEYFSLGNETAAMDIVTYISQNKIIAQDSVFSMVNSFLPVECRTGGIVNIYPVIDGNRGSFAEGNDIIMELSSYTEGNTPQRNSEQFIKTAAHEMHHVLYGNWLGSHYSDSLLTPAEKVIFDWQLRMIYEGTAQQVNYDMYSQDVRDLYMNKSLITELFEKWVSSFNKLASSTAPDSDYSELRNYLYNTFSVELLNKYYGSDHKSLLPYRPTIDYYISYHIYHTIYQTNGISGFNNVLLNPGELLATYNRCNSSPGELSSSPLPQIPEDIITLWRDVLSRAKIK